jgi:FkbM family methyltransferase
MKSRVENSLIYLIRYCSPFLRNFFILSLIKKMPVSVLKRYLEHNLDPNTIRKSKSLDFRQKLVIIDRAPLKMIVDLNDHIGYRYFLNEKFDDIAVQIGNKVSFKKNDIFLDIGANIGTVSLPFAKLFKCKCILVEASLVNASLLCLNVSMNRIESTILLGCVTSSETVKRHDFVKLYKPSGNSGASSVNKNWNTKNNLNNFEHARVYTLDTLIPERDLKKIKIIKLDIEGHEHEALSGFKKVSKTQALLIFEYRLDLMTKISKAYSTNLLKEIRKNFEIFTIDYKENDIGLKVFNPKISQNNVIGIPKSKLKYYIKKLQ